MIGMLHGSGTGANARHVERLPWRDAVVLTLYGLRVGVRTNDPAVLERLLTWLPAERLPAAVGVDQCYSLYLAPPGADGARRYHRLYAGERRIVCTRDAERACAALEGWLQLYFATNAREVVFVHAGVVGLRGQALLLPAASQAGKSTLVLALLRAGATYYSDDCAVLDEAGRVLPFARPIGIRRRPDAAPSPHPVSEFGAPIGTEAIPVGAVALTRYAPGARWSPRLLAPSRAWPALLAHTMTARDSPAQALRSIERVLAGAEVTRSTRGEAPITAERLLARYG
jgi:hypothetical protein